MPRKKNELTPVETKPKKKSGELKKDEKERKKRERAKRTQDIIRMVLTLTPEVPERTRTSLTTMGYDFDRDGNPSLETMILLMLAKQALQGDLNSIKFMYDYGLIPDIKAANEEKRIRIEEKKVNSLMGAVQHMSTNMQTIAELINNPEPDVDIEELTEQGRIELEMGREKVDA